MESKVIIAQTPNSSSPTQERLEDLSALDITFLSILSIGLFLSVWIPVYDFIFKRKQPADSPKSRTDPICTGCQYFNNNNYLKCALQPTIVMSEQSCDCQDYCPIQKLKPIQKVSKTSVIIRKFIK